MRLFKGFKPDLSCRSFKFKEGITYHEKTAKLCESGFHACIKPTDTFGYYPPNKSVYREVEMDPITPERGKDTKVCSSNINVGKRISVEDLINEERKYAIDKKRYSYLGTSRSDERSSDMFVHGQYVDYDAYSGDRSVSIASGYCKRAITGNRSIAKAGKFGHAISGYNSISEAGYHGLAVCKGLGKAISGDFGTSISQDDGTSISGHYGIAIAEKYAVVGNNGLIVVRDDCDIVVKAGIDSVIVLMIENGPLVFKIDGINYKPDTWYKIYTNSGDNDGEYAIEEASNFKQHETNAYFGMEDKHEAV